MALAYDARKSGLPRHQRQCRQIADRKKVRTVWLDAYAPDRKAGEARAFREHGLQMRNGHRLRLCHAVYVDELRQHVTDVLAGEVCLCRFDGVDAQGHRQRGGVLRGTRNSVV